MLPNVRDVKRSMSDKRRQDRYHDKRKNGKRGMNKRVREQQQQQVVPEQPNRDDLNETEEKGLDSLEEVVELSRNKSVLKIGEMKMSLNEGDKWEGWEGDMEIDDYIPKEWGEDEMKTDIEMIFENEKKEPTKVVQVKEEVIVEEESTIDKEAEDELDALLDM